MKGKGLRAVIMGLLILGLVLAQTTEAKTSCKNTTGRNCYNACLLPGLTFTTPEICTKICDCIIVEWNSCPVSHPCSSMFENSSVMNEYCKLGCASSVCNTITSNQNSDVREGEVNEAVEHCVNACSELCNNGVMTALASA